MAITTVLFDADGVIQAPAAGWHLAWADLIGEGKDADAFLNNLFQVEQPFLSGGTKFEDAVNEVLAEWECDRSFEEVLKVWTMIDPSDDLLDVVKSLSESGVQTGLATNQQSHRYEHMHSLLGYGLIFDEIFVSYRMGVTKPSEEYFQLIVDSMSIPAEQFLFFDDNEPNVKAAISVGMNAHQYHLKEGRDRMIELLRCYELPGV